MRAIAPFGSNDDEDRLGQRPHDVRVEVGGPGVLPVERRDVVRDEAGRRRAAGAARDLGAVGLGEKRRLPRHDRALREREAKSFFLREEALREGRDEDEEEKEEEGDFYE